MLRMKQILLVELISCGAVVKLTQFNERHSIERLLCQRNSCTFWPDDQPHWGKKGRRLNRSPNAGRTEPKWLTGSSCVSLDMKSVMQYVLLQRRQICPKYTDLPATYLSDSFTGTSEMFV